MTIQANFPAIKPALLLDFQNTKQLDSRITYTRASTASYYDGVTTSKAEENQLTYSNEVSTARWTGTALSTTINNSTSPDGTTTASLLTASANADSRLRITTTQAVSTTHTFSVYAKAGATSWLRLRNIGSNDCSGWFNLTTGAVGTVSGGTSAITSVGSGWYRCSITSTSAASIASNLLDMGAPSGDNTAAAAGGETISVWGIQLEARSSVTALTVTTTQAITNYIPKLQSAASGVARFDNNPTTGESLGLLIEESRTNLLTYSSQFDNAAWSKTNSTITANTIVAPDGTLTGDKLVDDTTFGNHSALQGSITFANATSYTITIYAKAGEIGYIKIGRATGTALPSLPTAYFNLITATVLGSPNANWTNYSITDVGNGWRRCSATVLTTGSGTDGIAIFLTDSSGNTGFTGNNYNGAYIWGAQLEAGAFATSYIPTVASQVTRAADAASMTGTNFSSWFNNAEGTLLFNATTASVANRGLFYASSNTDNRIFSYGTGNTLVFAANYNATTQFAISQNPNSLNNISAIAYKANDFAATSNGASVGTDTSGNVPVITQIQIGWLTNASDQNINGTIKKIAYYPLRVTNAQLQALTS